MRRIIVGITVGLALLNAAPADAAAPVLIGVSSDRLHPSAIFHAPGAENLNITFATSPERGTDGSFLTENVRHTDGMTADEIQTGRWIDSSQIDPGRYWVYLRASDFSCFDDPVSGCTSGFSNMLEVEIPAPDQRYQTSVDVLRNVRVIFLTIKITPAGKKPIPYRVCWRDKRRKQRCARGRVDGYSWTEPASDMLQIRLRGMTRRTEFVWTVGGAEVAYRRVRTVPA